MERPADAYHAAVAFLALMLVRSRAALLALVCGAAASAAQPVALPNAHAHNDYEHARPLLDALDHGFTSVEADVWLVDGALLVAHDRDAVRPERTLERLYLDPVRERARANGGRIYPGGPPLLLLVDVKSDAEATYARLHEVLRGYADVLTIWAGDAVEEGAVSVVLSGERARETMRAAPLRFASYDGRLPDLTEAADEPAAFMPLVSERWGRLADWDGAGPAPEALRAELARLADAAHAQGRRLRLWGTPEREAVWTVLLEAGVDLINTDDLAGLQAFLLRAAE